MKTAAVIGTILGTVAGGLYFWLEESGVPKGSNAQYLAPWTTDAIAWVCGAALIAQGMKHNDGIVTFIGSSVASIHVAQFAAHKVIDNRILSTQGEGNGQRGAL